MRRRPVVVDGALARITLTRGHVAVIDAADLPRVEAHTWTALVTKGKVYARRTVRLGDKQHTELLHRVVMGAPDDINVDHEDGDGLNCRRSNLRLATQAQNTLNTKLRADNRAGFKGVSKHTQCNKFKASIAVGGKRRHLGLFDTAEQAHAAYCAASVELHGEFRRTA